MNVLRAYSPEEFFRGPEALEYAQEQADWHSEPVMIAFDFIAAEHKYEIILASQVQASGLRQYQQLVCVIAPKNTVGEAQ